MTLITVAESADSNNATVHVTICSTSMQNHRINETMQWTHSKNWERHSNPSKCQISIPFLRAWLSPWHSKPEKGKTGGNTLWSPDNASQPITYDLQSAAKTAKLKIFRLLGISCPWMREKGFHKTLKWIFTIVSCIRTSKWVFTRKKLPFNEHITTIHDLVQK